jgi:mediator of RNA polymerase II transcription subunit 5
MDLMIEEWTLFLDRCLERRVQPDLFDKAAAQLHAKSPLPGREITSLLLRPRAANATIVDPRVIIFLERLLALKKVDASEVLSSAFQYSKDRLAKTGSDDVSKDEKWHNSPDLEEVLFHRLSKAFQAEERPLTNAEGFRTLIVVTRWMQAMVASHTSDTMIQVMAGIQQQPQQQSINVRDGLGMLMVGITENSKMLNILNNVKSKGPYCVPYSTRVPPYSHRSYVQFHVC